MNKLEVRKFDESILENATLITDGKGFFRTYDLNDGNIIKVLKDTSEWHDKKCARYADFIISQIHKKLLGSEEIKNPSIILPNTIYETDDLLKAYKVPKCDGYIRLNSYLNDLWSLELVTLMILKLSNIVKKANEDGIIFPDLGTDGNILIDPETCNIVLIDYDGMQIGDNKAFGISNLICNDIIRFTSFQPFCDFSTDLYTRELDKLSLYAMFLHFSLGSKFADFKEDDFESENGVVFPRIKEEAIHNYMKNIGIEDTLFEEELRQLFAFGECDYPDKAVVDVAKRYTIDFSCHSCKFISK